MLETDEVRKHRRERDRDRETARERERQILRYLIWICLVSNLVDVTHQDKD